MKARAITGRQKVALVVCRMLLMLSVPLMFRCAPIASELQSARLVGKHKAEVTASYTDLQFRKAPKQESQAGAQTGSRLLGVQAAYGLSHRVDLRVRVEQFRYNSRNNQVFSIGPKVTLIPDRLALYVPVWFVDFKPAQTQPTLLATIPLIRNKLEFNPSVKSILTTQGYEPMNGFMIGVNLGFAVSTNLSRWAIRPEFGTVYDIKGHRQFASFALGVTLNLGQVTTKH